MKYYLFQEKEQVTLLQEDSNLLFPLRRAKHKKIIWTNNHKIFAFK